MELKSLLLERSRKMWEEFIPHISVDCVVFGFDQSALKVLLLRLKDQDLWAIPGGYLKKDESLDVSASRILNERTGARNIYLEQFQVYGNLKRSEGFFEGYPDDLWHKQRFVSIGVYALVNYTDVSPVVDDFSDRCEWRDIHELPQLMMDHRQILDEALLTLRRQLNYKPIGYNLLSEKFTMPELQKLYEIILGRKLNRGNFYRKILRFGILEKLNESRKGGAHKAPDLYRFDQGKYQEALREGLQSEW